MKIYLFYCSNKLDGEEVVRRCHSREGDQIKAIALPCSGKINILYLIKAFETGAEGVLMLVCPAGKCHNLQGNVRAQKRVEAVDSLMEEVGIGAGRIEIIQLKDNDEDGDAIEQAIVKFEDFLDKIRTMPVLNNTKTMDFGINSDMDKQALSCEL